jgi:chromosome segregation ATPase
VREAKEKIEADLAALNVKIQSQLAEKHCLELHYASLGSQYDQVKEKSRTLVHEVDKLTAAKGLLSGHMDYLVKTHEQMKMLLHKDRLTMKVMEEENLKLKATCSNLRVQITKGLKEQIKQSERTLVAYEARDKSRDYLKLMTESTRKPTALLKAVKKENNMLKAKINEFERLQQDQIASK